MRNEVLRIFWGNCHVGDITRNGNSIDFAYTKEWMLYGMPISQSMKYSLPEQELSLKADHFFRNLLPDGAPLESMAVSAGLDRHDLFGMLARYGKDCVGALSFRRDSEPTDRPEPFRPYELRAVTEDVLAYMNIKVKGQSASLQAWLGENFLIPGAQDKYVRMILSDNFAGETDEASSHPE